MKTVFEHIEYVQGKPHHVRRRVAFAAAAGVSGLVALVWLAGSFTTGAFAIQGSNFAMSTGQQNVVATTSDAVTQGLAGVSAAAVFQNTNAPAHIEIVDTPAARAVKQPEQTTIPF